ncbi:MAG: J domain-containing protein, partial [Patescibacteria group bacterium]|nr:J domain-containing protein [Patescibacteria group bacterium]
ASYTDSSGKFCQRTVQREASVSDAIGRLQAETDRLGARQALLSSNVELRLDGLPRSNQKEPDDPGVACYFTLNGRKTVLACDRWTRVADNIIAIAKHIEALRGQDRWGVGNLEQAFRGYQALEDFSAGVAWRRILGIKDGEAVTRELVETRYREHARRLHPDLGGDDGVQMRQLNQAVADARKELSGAEAVR